MENNNKINSEEEAINPNEEGTPEEEMEGDEMLDDNYILQLHQYLQEMKRQRKEAEQNTNLLNGRLRCLRDEEKKTLKKIEVTRKKTESKMNQLQQQQEDLRRKMEFRNRKQKELEMLKEKNKKQKENNRLAIMMKNEERRRQMEEDIRNLREQKKTAENIEYRIAELRIELTRCQLDLFKDSKLATGIKHNDRELYTGDVFQTRNKEYLMIIISEEYENSYAIVGTAFPEELALQYPKNREILKNTVYLGNMYNDDKLADFLAELQLQQEELQEKQNNTDDKPSDDSNDSDNKGDEEDRG